MNHKRGRPKNRRAGCLLCKPHKANGAKGTRGAKTLQERRCDSFAPYEMRRWLRGDVFERFFDAEIGFRGPPGPRDWPAFVNDPG